MRSGGVAILGIGVVLNTWSLVLNMPLAGAGVLDAVTVFPLPLLGALLVWKKPDQPVGWLMLLLGAAIGATGVGNGIVQSTGGRGAGSGVAQAVNHVAFSMLVGLFSLMLALFPTGRVATRRWHLVPWLSVAAILGISLSGLFGMPDDPLEPKSPLAIESAGWVFELVGGVGLVSGFLALVGGGASVILRARSAHPVERAQIKWFAFPVGLLVTVLLLGITPLFRGPAAERVFDALLALIAGMLLPACIAIAILRHRLFDIDVVVNRTLVYGSLTAILGASYLATVVVLQRLLQPVTAASDLAVAVSTLTVAALFGPLRSRVQAFIDRRFYRPKYDAVRTLSGFSAHLREQVDLDSLRAELVDVVRETMQPAHATLWLRPSAQEHP